MMTEAHRPHRRKGWEMYNISIPPGQTVHMKEPLNSKSSGSRTTSGTKSFTLEFLLALQFTWGRTVASKPLQKARY